MAAPDSNYNETLLHLRTLWTQKTSTRTREKAESLSATWLLLFENQTLLRERELGKIICLSYYWMMIHFIKWTWPPAIKRKLALNWEQFREVQNLFSLSLYYFQALLFAALLASRQMYIIIATCSNKLTQTNDSQVREKFAKLAKSNLEARRGGGRGRGRGEGKVGERAIVSRSA